MKNHKGIYIGAIVLTVISLIGTLIKTKLLALNVKRRRCLYKGPTSNSDWHTI